jgi:hypothetical protein
VERPRGGGEVESRRRWEGRDLRLGCQRWEGRAGRQNGENGGGVRAVGEEASG